MKCDSVGPELCWSGAQGIPKLGPAGLCRQAGCSRHGGPWPCTCKLAEVTAIRAPAGTIQSPCALLPWWPVHPPTSCQQCAADCRCGRQVLEIRPCRLWGLHSVESAKPQVVQCECRRRPLRHTTDCKRCDGTVAAQPQVAATSEACMLKSRGRLLQSAARGWEELMQL